MTTTTTRKVLRLDPRCGNCVSQIQHTEDEHDAAIAAYRRHAGDPCHEFEPGPCTMDLYLNSCGHCGGDRRRPTR